MPIKDKTLLRYEIGKTILESKLFKRTLPVDRSLHDVDMDFPGKEFDKLVDALHKLMKKEEECS